MKLNINLSVELISVITELWAQAAKYSNLGTLHAMSMGQKKRQDGLCSCGNRGWLLAGREESIVLCRGGNSVLVADK